MNPNLQQQSRTRQAKRAWTSIELIKWTKGFFAEKGIESPRLEAELLLADVLECDRVQLYTNFEQAIDPELLARFRSHVKRRAEDHEPVQYILGHTDFMGLKLKVTPAVLIPRPETEELATWALGVLKDREGEEINVLDLGTGSGCLGLAIAAKEERVRLTTVDIETDAVSVARENAETHGLSERVTFLEGDLFEPLPAEQKAAFDLIVSNPPYINPELKNTLTPEVREHEPARALFTDGKGMAIIDRIAAEAGNWLVSGGWLGIEISPELSQKVSEALSAAGGFEDIEVEKDLSKNDRYVVAKRSE